MLFSLLIPVYNTSKYLESCLNSILQQTFKDFEVIIIDDGSTDNSANICANYVKQNINIHYYYQENSGLYSARYNAMVKAKGEYLVFVDSDDSIEPNCLQNLYEVISARHPDLVVFDANIVNDKNEIKDIRTLECNSGSLSIRYVLSLMIKGDSFNPIWMKSIRRSLFKPEDKYFGVNMAEDVIYTTSMLKRIQTIEYIKSKLYNYRINDNSITRNIRVDHFVQSNIAKNCLLSFVEKTFGSDSPETKLYLKRYVKGIAWYISRVEYDELLNSQNKIDEIKKSSIYMQAKKTHKFNFVYKILIELFEKNKYGVIIRFMRLLK